MASPTNYYVDPSGGSDVSGDGSLGNPWATVQHALDSITRNSSGGDQINVKAGGVDTLSSPLSLATYGSPSAGSPLIIRGYTATAGDGGVGTISGGGSVPIYSEDTFYMRWVDMELTDSGSDPVLTIGSFSMVVNCEVHNTSNDGIAANLASQSVISGCHVHDCGRYGIYAKICIVENCYLKNDGTHSFVEAIRVDRENSSITRNIISIDGASNGIRLGQDAITCTHNSILSTSGSGIGINMPVNYMMVVHSNLIEGFSGSGGVGMDASTTIKGVATHNSIYNCTTPVVGGDSLFEDNEILGSSPFAKSGNDTFANRATYFEPEDVGEVYGGAWGGNGTLDRGAVQHTASSGGGGSTVIVIEDD